MVTARVSGVRVSRVRAQRTVPRRFPAVDAPAATRHRRAREVHRRGGTCPDCARDRIRRGARAIPARRASLRSVTPAGRPLSRSLRSATARTGTGARSEPKPRRAGAVGRALDRRRPCRPSALHVSREQPHDAADEGRGPAAAAPAGEHREARAPLQPVDSGARQADPRLARPAAREARARREARRRRPRVRRLGRRARTSVRPSSVVDAEGRVRLCVEPARSTPACRNHVRWHRSAEKLLSVGRADVPLPDYISGLVPWRRESAVALLEHIERTTGRPWLARSRRRGTCPSTRSTAAS